MKGESGVVNDGLWQLVAALHVIKGFSSHWPVGKSGVYFRGNKIVSVYRNIMKLPPVFWLCCV